MKPYRYYIEQPANLSEVERDRFEERAAILEYEAGFSRAQAEELALQEILNMRKEEPLAQVG